MNDSGLAGDYQFDEYGRLVQRQINPKQSYRYGDKPPYDQSNPDMNGWEKFGMGANALTGLAGAYNAYKQYGLQKDQFNFNRNLSNRNIANSAATTNAQLERAASIGAQMTTGARKGDAEYELAKERLYRPVDGSAIV